MRRCSSHLFPLLPIFMFFSSNTAAGVSIADDTLHHRVMLISRFEHYSIAGFGYGSYRSDISFLYYGFLFENDLETITEVNFPGTNLAKALRPVPQTRGWMEAYKWSRIASIPCLIAGIGTTLSGLVYALNENPDGRFGNRVPLIIGLSTLGLSASLEVSRHVWIHIAVGKYNESVSKTAN